MVFRPSLPPNHSKTTRILPDGRGRGGPARLRQDVRHGAEAAEQAEPEAAGAEPQQVAPRDAAAAQWILGCHGTPPLERRAKNTTAGLPPTPCIPYNSLSRIVRYSKGIYAPDRYVCHCLDRRWGLIAAAQQPSVLPMGPARERGASITPAFEGWYRTTTAASAC